LNPWVEWLEMLFDELTRSNLFLILEHMLYYEGLLQGLQKVLGRHHRVCLLVVRSRVAAKSTITLVPETKE
jgi:hypothetical protein